MLEELERLLSRTSQGDRVAFERLYELTSGKLFAVSLQLLQRKDLAQDALQDAYIKIWHNAGDYQQEKGTVISWMISIVRYRALDILRYRKVRGEVSDDLVAESEDIQTRPDTNLYEQRERARIDGCMDGLDIGQRDAIQLAYFRGFTHAEVCTNLGSPLGTVKSWIRRGLEQLKRCLGQ